VIRMTLEAAAAVLGIETESQLIFTGISSDSREVEPGMLFAALPGERVDGHDYIAEAEEAGAIAVLVQRPVRSRVPQLRVGSVLHALGQLAEAWRAEHAVRVVALTGSNGKTTTKELLANILRQSGAVLATRGNYNNELGLPLTLFELSAEHDFAVLEMGASKAGDIRYLAGLAKPEVGVITNVGPAHLKGFGDEAGVAHAKGELYASLPADGFAVFNSEEPWLPVWEDLNRSSKTLTFGFSDRADVRATTPDGSDEWTVTTPQGSFELTLQLPGTHNVLNALAAAAAALALGIGLEQIRAGLAATQPVPGRLNLIPTPGGWKLIDDSYNANPASTRAALEVLAALPGETWFALGDMRELGDESEDMHAKTGSAARALGIRRLFATGNRSRAAVTAFGEGGAHFADRDALIEALRREIHPGVTCLVKGSRSLGMEKVVHALGAGDGEGLN